MKPPTPAPGQTDPVIDWAALERLRAAFLAGTAGTQDYWQNESDLASYDATFAQRIGWKWDFVLEDLRQRGWVPPEGGPELVDWGCGSGIAARAFLDAFPHPAVGQVRFLDRSPLATAFAARRAARRFPGVPILEGPAAEPGSVERPTVVLLSHVLTELNPEQTGALLAELTKAAAVLWVEPGTYETSLSLIAIRERLREVFQPIAPCLHRGRCGILAPGNEPHWCHHFARPPGGVFTDPFWGRFAHATGIDLRSVPLSYLVLDRRPLPPPEAGVARLIGRPRILKAEARVLACRTNGAVREHPISKRHRPEAFTAARKDRFPSLAVVDPPSEEPADG